MLPLWLSPTQVRVIPVSENFFNEAEKIGERLAKKLLKAGGEEILKEIYERV